MIRLFGYGIILQALAIVHFVRRRPDGFWLWIIIFGGGLGALVYLLVEAVPDARLLSASSFRVFPRRSRIHELQLAILDNPAPGNYEELADLYREDGDFAAARAAYDKALGPRTDSPHALYGRGLAEIELGDLAAARADLERVVTRERNHDYWRALGLLAYVTAQLGDREGAARLFEEALTISTLSETQFNYACLLAAQGRTEEARQLAQRLLAKKATLPAYLRRRERPWFSRASAFLRQLPPRGANVAAS